MRNNDRGMALLEILIVLALIALVSATIGVMVVRRYKDAQIRIAQIQVREVAGLVQQHVALKGDCPTDLVGQRVMNSEPRDPWGSRLAIDCPGTHDPDGVDVASHGPDKRAGTGDDIVSWTR